MEIVTGLFAFFGLVAAGILFIYGIGKVVIWLTWLHKSIKHFQGREAYWNEYVNTARDFGWRLKDLEKVDTSGRLIKIENTLACPEIVVLLNKLNNKKAKANK